MTHRHRGTRSDLLRLIALAVLALLGHLVNAPAQAQDTLRAAAVVNDEVISMLDLAMRTRLAIVSSGLEDSRETRARLQPQVLRALIDERLQTQEAERLDLQVSDAQLNAALDQIARQNNLSRDQLMASLQRNGILPNALTEQVRAGIAWQGVVARRLRPEIDITDEEVDEVVARIERSSSKPELLVSEIFLSVDDALQEEDVLRTAERLIEQLRGGADFAALARQFSQSATAPVGGDLGWVREGQLPDEITQTLADMRPGMLSRPIRTYGGVYILLLRDQRQLPLGDETVALKQIFFAVPPGASEDDVKQAAARAAQLRPRITDCDTADAVAKAVGSPGSGDLGRVKLTDLPPTVRQAVATLPTGQPSGPIQLAGGVGLLLVCDREGGQIDRDRIRQGLVEQRLSQRAQHYLRDLRRAANVDVRL